MWPGADDRIGTPGRHAAIRAPDGPVVAQGPALAPGPASDRPVSCAGLIRRVRSYDPGADTDAIERAFVLASRAHEGQRRDNGEPYIVHPLAVAGMLAGFRLDVASICTGLLHDTVEDTGLKLPQLEAQFGPTVAALVDGVTKLNRLELQSDRTKQAENFRKLVLAMSRDIRVLVVKLADRLHNMRTLNCVRENSRRQRIASETMDIYAPLAGRIGMDKVKTELQDLSFAELEPEHNATIRARLNYLRGQGADVIEEVRCELARLCADAGVPQAEVTGREKSPFSIWEKMQKRNVAFEQLSDIMAFRVMVPTREACYVALGAVHGAYPTIAGRFKDYISTPKTNGYQSLHTGVTLRSPRNQKIEVQIRTPEMHDVAENGVAAHWSYKGLGEDSPGEGGAAPVRRLRWVQDLLEILENSAAPDEFMENTRLELYQDQVFCFSPKGQLISLPRGATPVDFAYAVHSQIGDSCVGAKVNGRLMPLRHELQNGDQVEIMTARGGTPSPQWERFCVTGKARARIRRFVAQQQRQAGVVAELQRGRARVGGRGRGTRRVGRGGQSEGGDRRSRQVAQAQALSRKRVAVRELVSIASIVTGASVPIRHSGPSACTACRNGERPAICPGLRPRPVNSTGMPQPTLAALKASCCARISACRRASRSSLTASGTWPAAAAAGVPGRGEYLNEKACAKPTWRTSASVASKSASVSPGWPTMKSDDSARSGRVARRRDTSER